jgi:flagellar basal body-associated protein FliL
MRNNNNNKTIKNKMKKAKKILLAIGGAIATAAAGTAVWKMSEKIARLEGENVALKSQVDAYRHETIKTAASQSYHNGRNAERAAKNVE